MDTDRSEESASIQIPSLPSLAIAGVKGYITGLVVLCHQSHLNLGECTETWFGCTSMGSARFLKADPESKTFSL